MRIRQDHKKARVYGLAVVWFYDDLYLLTGMYVRTVRRQFLIADSNLYQAMASHQHCLWCQPPCLGPSRGKVERLK